MELPLRAKADLRVVAIKRLCHTPHNFRNGAFNGC